MIAGELFQQRKATAGKAQFEEEERRNERRRSGRCVIVELAFSIFFFSLALTLSLFLLLLHLFSLPLCLPPLHSSSSSPVLLFLLLEGAGASRAVSSYISFSPSSQGASRTVTLTAFSSSL